MRYVLAGLLAVIASVISAETIEIRTVADLQSVSDKLDATYELMNDIDLSGVSFAPIGGVDRWGADAISTVRSSAARRHPTAMRGYHAILAES